MKEHVMKTVALRERMSSTLDEIGDIVQCRCDRARRSNYANDLVHGRNAATDQELLDEDFDLDLFEYGIEDVF